MPSYVAMDPNTLLPGEPWTSAKALAAFENLDATMEGAVGAPRLLDAALGSTPTNAGRDWVLARTALAAVGAVGTYALLSDTSTGSVITQSRSAGSTLAAASLLYASAGGTTFGGPSGTWRLMGYSQWANVGTLPQGSPLRVSLWLRIA